MRWTALRTRVLAAGALMTVVVLGLALASAPRSGRVALVLEVGSATLPADGFSTVPIVVRPAGGRPLPREGAGISIVEGTRRAQVESLETTRDGTRARVRAGLLAGPVVLEARAPGFSPARGRLDLIADLVDQEGDGLPDVLRLEDEADRQAFRGWFTYLAEAQFFRPEQRRPIEIDDCAALVRYAYREALREHTADWAAAQQLDGLEMVQPIRKYHYPFTPLGAGLFRVRPGPFRRDDVRDGAFAQFADASILQRWNTHPIGRDLRRARPGDLLFYHQIERDLPNHVIIFLGPSHFEEGAGPWVLYHTGPTKGSPGEIRRVLLEDLERHPKPRWRPVAGNRNFAGVFRWNILRETDE